MNSARTTQESAVSPFGVSFRIPLRVARGGRDLFSAEMRRYRGMGEVFFRFSDKDEIFNQSLFGA